MLQRVLLVVVLMFAVSAFAQKGNNGGGSKGGSSGSSGTSTVPTGINPGRGPLGYPNNNPMSDPRFNGYSTIFDPLMGSMRTMTPQEERLYRAMQKQRNLEREKAMRTDTEKLLALTRSLQDDVNGNPSGDTEKKASQIEKLAKNVKNKMTGEN